MLRAVAALLVIVSSAVMAASTPMQGVADAADGLQQARREAAEAQAQRQRLERVAAAARDEATRLRARQLAAAKAIVAAEARISAADARARLLGAQLTAQRQKLAAQQAPMSALLAGLALSSRRPPVLFIADTGSAEELVKLRLLIAAAMPAIEERTSAIAEDVRRTRQLERAALAARDDRMRTRDELSRRRFAFAELESEAVRLAQARGAEALGAGDLAIARSEQVGGFERQARSSAASRRLARELAKLGPAPLPPPPASAAAPPLRYRLPSDAAVIDGLGSVSANGIRSRGITLATRRGAPLIAPAGGTILFAGPFRGYDGLVIIDHGRGWKSVLVNAAAQPGAGTRVAAGAPLGVALGPVEVQLQRDGRPVSPALIAGSSAPVSNRAKGG